MKKMKEMKKMEKMKTMSCPCTITVSDCKGNLTRFKVNKIGEIYIEVNYPDINKHISSMLIMSAVNIIGDRKDLENNNKLIKKIWELSCKINTTMDIIPSVKSLVNMYDLDDLDEEVSIWLNSIFELGYVQTDSVIDDKMKRKFTKKWKKMQKRQQSIYFKIYFPGQYVHGYIIRIDDTGYGFKIECDGKVIEYIPHDWNCNSFPE